MKKRYKPFFKENILNLSDAMQLFDIEKVPDENELKSLYRKMSIKYHPDKGGSDELMKDVNQAYDILKKNIGVGSIQNKARNKARNRAEEIKQQEAKNKVHFRAMEDLFNRSFNEQELKKYLQKFTSEELHIDKQQPDFDKIKDYEWYSFRYYHVIVNIHNENNTLVFHIGYHISPAWKTSGGLSYDNQDDSEILYEMIIDSDVYYNNRKNKLGKSSWQWRVGHSVLKEYDKIFPASKLKKILGGEGKKSFKKSDMYLGIEREIGPITTETNGLFLYPFGKNAKFYFWVSRNTFRGLANYNIGNFVFIDPDTKKYNSRMRLDYIVSIYETEEDLRKLSDCINEVKKLVKQKHLDTVEDATEIFELFKMSFKHYFPKRY